MYEMTISQFKKATVEELKDKIPIQLISNGEVLATLVNTEEIIVLTDLHPRVRIALKAQEKRARAGMPPTLLEVS